MKSGAFKLGGCNMGIFNAKAVFFTALSLIFWPRPAGLSAAVTTQTTLSPAATIASKEAEAKSGVPKKIIRNGVTDMTQR
jgi:hypothetical protein